MKDRWQYVVIIFITGLVLIPLLTPLLAYSFGKNKVNWDTFSWVYHQTDHFRIYYYPESRPLVLEIADIFEEKYEKIKTVLGQELDERIPVLIYRTRHHFRQTNVILDFIPSGVAGFNEPIKNRIVIPIEGSRRDLRELIAHELTHSFEFELFTVGGLGELAQVPLWIMEGLSEHIAGDWDAVGRMVLRDAVINNHSLPLNQLDTFDRLYQPYIGYKLAQSAVDYMIDTYGVKSVQDFVWEMRRLLKSKRFMNDAVEQAFGIEFEELNRRWERRLRDEILLLEANTEDLSVYGKPLTRLEQYQRTFNPVPSPGGDWVAFLSHNKLRLDIYLQSRTHENQYKPPVVLTDSIAKKTMNSIITDGRPFDWSPDGEHLVFFTQGQKQPKLVLLDVPGRRVKKTFKMPVEDASSPYFSPDGRSIVFSAGRNGQSDLFILQFDDWRMEQVTDDAEFDSTPAWSPQGDRIAWIRESFDGETSLAIMPRTGEAKIINVPISGTDPQLPDWSPDGHALVFTQSNQWLVSNLYHYDLNLNRERQITNAFTGVFAPRFSRNGKEVFFTVFFNAMQNVYRLPVTQEPETVESPCQAPPPAFQPAPYQQSDAQPPSPDQTDKETPEENNVAFRILPDFVIGGVAYSSSGDFYVDGGILLSDILGNHRFLLTGSRVTPSSNILFQYWYLRHRWDLGVNLYQASDYQYYFGNRYERQAYGGDISLIYPFSTYYRFEVGYSTLWRNDDFTYSELESDYNLSHAMVSLVGDTVEWAYFGPLNGHRWNLTYSYPIGINDETIEYDYLLADVRQYLRLSRRSLLAFRLSYRTSTTDDVRAYFSYGGAGTVRGWPYGQFSGSNLAFSNLELRFPFIELIGIAGTPMIAAVRGVLYVDTGMAWDKWEEVQFYSDGPEDYQPEHMKGSIGFGFNAFVLGLPCHFEFSRRTDWKKIYSDTRYEFSIRLAF